MPMYEFQCAACGHCFEEIAPSGSESAPCPCPSCGSSDSNRQLSAPSLKTGAAPFKVGPVRPMAPRKAGGGCAGGCGGCGGNSSIG